MSFSKRSDSGAVCYTKLLDSLKHWNGHFFWVDAFACPALFPWHTDKNISKDPFPKSTEYSADDYDVLVAHPAPFRKFSEPFLCLIGMIRYYTLDEDTYPRFLRDNNEEMDFFAFINTADPTKVKVVERERVDGEPRLLETTVGGVVPLLPVAPARSEGELEASVDKLFDEGGGADQGDTAAGGSYDAVIEPATDVEAVAAQQPQRRRKKKRAATNTAVAPHPPKRLRENYGTSGAAAVGGKSPSVIKKLLESSVLNAEVGVAALPTLPFVTSFVTPTPEREDADVTDSITGPNFRTIAAMLLEAGTTSPAHVSIFHDSDSTETLKADVPGPSYSAKQDLSVGSRGLNAETLHQVFHNGMFEMIPCSDVSRDFVDHLAPPALFSQIREMDYHHLFTEFNVGTARQACLNAEVRMRTEYCLSERRRLETECEKQVGMLKSKDDEIESLKARLLLKEAEAAEALRLRAQVEAAEKAHAFEVSILKQQNTAYEHEKNILNKKAAELQSLSAIMEQELADLSVAASSLRSQNVSWWVRFPMINRGNPANPLSKTQALANTASLDRTQTTGGGFVCGLAEWLKPPKGYVCHRCKIPGRLTILEYARLLIRKFIMYGSFVSCYGKVVLELISGV
ncbi:hypothetical protein Tco_0167413 [Tanacetum coccineum]